MKYWGEKFFGIPDLGYQKNACFSTNIYVKNEGRQTFFFLSMIYHKNLTFNSVCPKLALKTLGKALRIKSQQG